VRHEQFTCTLLTVVCLSALAMAGFTQPTVPDILVPAAIDRSNADARGYVAVAFARSTADISSEVAGVLLDYRVRLGDRVRAGQVIARVDGRFLQQDLASAEAALRGANAQRDRAEVELDQAHQMSERRQRMAWALSKEEVEAVVTREKLARANLDLASSQIREQAARVEEARGNLEKCTIRAPFAGSVGRLHQNEGTYLTVGMPVARLVADSDLWVRFAVPPGEASWLVKGVQARAILDGRQATIRVENIAPEVDVAAGMIFVEARVLRADAPIRAGASGRVWRNGGTH